MTGFTFYKSFYETIKKIRNPRDRANAILAICEYMFEDKELDASASETVEIVFQSVRHTLDKSKKNGVNGSETKPKRTKVETETKDNRNKIELQSNKNRNEIETETRLSSSLSTSSITPLLSPQGEGETGEKSAKERFFETYPTVWANLRYFKGDDSHIDYNVLLQRFAESSELRKKYSFNWIANNYGGIKAGVFADRKNEATAAADARSERERWYAKRRQQAISSAERVKKKFLESYPWYEDYEKGERVAEIALAKAEVAYSKRQTAETSMAVEEAKKELAHFNEQKTSVLECAGLTEKDFEPKYHCEKCSDTGFLPNGLACDCYQKEK